MSINKVVFSGNLTRDCELRRTQSGVAVANYTIAVNEKYKDKQSGEIVDKAIFVDCHLWGNRAEALEQYLSKGSKVVVAGKLEQSHWEDKQGNKRISFYVNVTEVDLCGSRSNEQVEQSSNSRVEQQTVANEVNESSNNDVDSQQKFFREDVQGTNQSVQEAPIVHPSASEEYFDKDQVW